MTLDSPVAFDIMNGAGKVIAHAAKAGQTGALGPGEAARNEILLRLAIASVADAYNEARPFSEARNGGGVPEG